jgi:hypothetical protein
MTREEILRLYRQGKNHLQISHMVYAYNKADNKNYTMREAEEMVVDVILEANKRPNNQQ